MTETAAQAEVVAAALAEAGHPHKVTVEPDGVVVQDISDLPTAVMLKAFCLAGVETCCVECYDAGAYRRCLVAPTTTLVPDCGATR